MSISSKREAASGDPKASRSSSLYTIAFFGVISSRLAFLRRKRYGFLATNRAYVYDVTANATAPPEKNNDLHSGSANCAYLDGHCASRRYEFFLQATTLGGTDEASHFWNHIQIGN